MCPSPQDLNAANTIDLDRTSKTPNQHAAIDSQRAAGAGHRPATLHRAAWRVRRLPSRRPRPPRSAVTSVAGTVGAANCSGW
jgi:hypothetical protein